MNLSVGEYAMTMLHRVPLYWPKHLKQLLKNFNPAQTRCRHVYFGPGWDASLLSIGGAKFVSQTAPSFDTEDPHLQIADLLRSHESPRTGEQLLSPPGQSARSSCPLEMHSFGLIVIVVSDCKTVPGTSSFSFRNGRASRFEPPRFIPEIPRLMKAS